MKKIFGAFGRVIYTVVALVLGVLGLLLFVLLSPARVDSVTLLGVTTTTTITFQSFVALFGGESETTISVVIGEISQEATLGKATLQFDYLAVIGLALALVGLILLVVFYRSKMMSLIASFLCLGGAVFGYIQPTTFAMVNEITLNEVTSVVAPGGICLGVMFTVLFVLGLLRAVFAKNKK